MQPNPLALRPPASVAVLDPPPGSEPRRAPSGPTAITADQYRAMLASAERLDHRLLLRVLWESGARVGEVLHLRPCDVDPLEAALHLPNEKQRRRERRTKLVYISRDLAAELHAVARGMRLGQRVPFFRSRQSGSRPMHRSEAWRVVTGCARRAGVLVPGQRGELVPASPLNFRHGSAVHQLRSGVPLSEVQQQLGHSRLESTLVYLRLTNPERRAIADQVTW